MHRVDQYLKLIDDPNHPPLQPGDPADGPLLSLLVHLAYADGIVQDDEFALLARVRPDLDSGEILEWASGVAATDFDLDSVIATCTDEASRWSCLRFAARMVCLDGDLHAEELEHLHEMAHQMGLPADASSTVVGEIVAEGGPVEPDQVFDSLRHMFWDVLVPSRDDLSSDLAACVPPGMESVCSISLDDQEVAGLFVEGLVGRFDSGPAFIRWDDIVSYTRVAVPGAAFHLHTTDGRDLGMSDARLRDVGALLDFIYGRKPIR